MNFKSNKLTYSVSLALAFAAAGCFMAGCDRKPPAAPISVDETQSDYRADMQSALTGYAQTFKLAKEDLKPGLTLIFQGRDNPRVDGTMVVTGETSPAGCPVFNTVTHLHWHDDDGTRSTPAKIALCP